MAAMTFRTDLQIIKECESLGETGVEAGLLAGTFADNQMPAYRWLLEYRQQKHEKERRAEALRTLSALIASWVLAGLAFATFLWQTHHDREEMEHQNKELKLQQTSYAEQRNDAKALLAVQISVELDKQFDSKEMRGARRRLAKELLAHKDATEDRVMNFFDTLGMYTHKGWIDEDTVYSTYSYYVERYWAAQEQDIAKFRKAENDPGYFTDFEELDEEFLQRDANDARAMVNKIMPSEDEVHDFLEDEAQLAE